MISQGGLLDDFGACDFPGDFMPSGRVQDSCSGLTVLMKYAGTMLIITHTEQVKSPENRR